MVAYTVIDEVLLSRMRDVENAEVVPRIGETYNEMDENWKTTEYEVVDVSHSPRRLGGTVAISVFVRRKRR